MVNFLYLKQHISFGEMGMEQLTVCQLSALLENLVIQFSQRG